MRRILWLLGGGFLLLFISLLISLSIGTAQVPLVTVWSTLLKQFPIIREWMIVEPSLTEETILMKVRLPRVCLAMLVGMCLSLAGAGFQGVLRNPLADPYTLGAASGASVGAAFMILFHLYVWGQWSVPPVAFVTAMISLWIVFKLARVGGKLRTETIILSGIVVQAFLSSIVSFLVSMSDDVINEIVFWMMGSLSLRGWEYVVTLLPYAFVGLIVMLYFARALNLLALGEEEASHLGVHVERTKMIVLIVSTLITAASVSMTGVIGFVGLVIPHLVRLFDGA